MIELIAFTIGTVLGIVIGTYLVDIIFNIGD